MPTVLVFTWFYLPYIGGSELFVQAVTRHLSHRFRFIIVTARANRSLLRKEALPEGELVRVGVGSRMDKFLYPVPALRAALSLERVDLVHAVMVNAAALSAWAYLGLKPRPSLLTMQSGDSEQYVRNYMGPLFPLYRFLHRPFDRIHAISTHLRDRAIRFGAEPGSITIVPNGVDASRFEGDRADPEATREIRSRLAIEGKRVVISVSRLTEKNGIDTLLRAFALLVPDHPDAVLVLVGDGEERPKLESLAGALSVRDRVRFVGSVEPSRVSSYLSAADVFARPSVSEGLGNAFLEAMASRLPIVATGVGGIGDFLTDGVNGLLCESGRPESVASALARLLSDPAMARRMGDAGWELANERYRWESVAERIGEIYDELLSRRRPPSSSDGG